MKKFLEKFIREFKKGWQAGFKRSRYGSGDINELKKEDKQRTI